MISSSNETDEVRGEFSACSLQEMRETVSSLSCLLADDEEPLEVSVCGNGLVEAGEECDCGEEEVRCDDPCCYPAIISQAERSANISATVPMVARLLADGRCHRRQSQPPGPDSSPASSPQPPASSPQPLLSSILSTILVS